MGYKLKCLTRNCDYWDLCDVSDKNLGTGLQNQGARFIKKPCAYYQPILKAGEVSSENSPE